VNKELEKAIEEVKTVCEEGEKAEKRFTEIMNILIQQQKTIAIATGEYIENDEDYEWYFLVNHNDYRQIRTVDYMLNNNCSVYYNDTLAGIQLLVVHKDIEPKLVKHDRRLFKTK